MTYNEILALEKDIEKTHVVNFSTPRHVHFDESECVQSVVDFLVCFDCQTSLAECDRSGATCQVKILPHLSDGRKNKLGMYIYFLWGNSEFYSS